MTESRWRTYARDLIAKLVADLPADATQSERRKALWGNGYPAHGGTKWGRKMWGQEVRKYLARCEGGQPRALGGKTAADFGPDIHFPFREGNNA